MDTDTFRALARSSPWLWSSVRLDREVVRRDARDTSFNAPARAWIRRPGRMRVEQPGQPAYAVDESADLGSNIAWFGATNDGSPWKAPTPRSPQDPLAPQPQRRDDDLVSVRPDGFEVVYDDPMHENYLWVAMLDPVELADGRTEDDGTLTHEAPVEFLQLTEVSFAGRASLEAVVRPTDSYDPRCSCCPLLHSEISDAYEQQAGAPPQPPMRYADAYRVVLDRATGICVSMHEVGGDDDGAGFDVTIGEVDVDYPDTLFG